MQRLLSSRSMIVRSATSYYGSVSAVSRNPPPSRNLSVLASTDWKQWDRCQFMVHSPINRIQIQQVRFRRHDRASAFTKPRPKTKKQRQAYNRRLKRMEEEKAKHSPPGFRAGPRRQFARERWQQLLDKAKGKELATLGEGDNLEYGMEDALIEDLLGNTSHLTSQPTPEPVYLGHRHQEFYNVVAKQMNEYRNFLNSQAQWDDGGKQTQDVLDLDTHASSLPSDEDISKVLRAYRDRNGTRSRPIGIAMALEHVLKDLGVPIAAFGENTFTTLLTCCRTPNEARRIMKLMNDQQHPISSYSWSILVDVHAKMGDFEGCQAVIKEMAYEGTPPTQAAYTSLLAACYKVCNDGRIPHAIRAKAGEVGWNHWQEMRIVGIEADAMAYGAIIRLCATRGQAERAINLLDEMNRFEVKPTTLCFAGALRAVARSHEIGVRFERGSSRKQLRRELFAAHHGKMARQIVIMAEQAEVEMDEGFVSALMLCAAAAGDSATAKAVYLAAEVRKMDHLRTIGPESSLAMLRGESAQLNHDDPDILQLPGSLDSSDTKEVIQTASSETAAPTVQPTNSSGIAEQGSGGALETVYQQRRSGIKAFGEREYGKDTRALSALLRSCGQAMSANGLGTMWAGTTNQGYLDENSLRLITTRWEPSYTPTSIPDNLSTKVGISSLRRYDENDREETPKKGAARQKFRGLYLDDDGVQLIDEYAETYGTGREGVDETIDASAFISNDARMTTQRPPSESQNIDTTAIATQQSGAGTTIPTTTTESGGGKATKQTTFEDDFQIFFRELQEEVESYGLGGQLTEDEAREIFSALQDELSDEFDEIEEDENDAIDVVAEQPPGDSASDTIDSSNDGLQIYSSADENHSVSVNHELLSENLADKTNLKSSNDELAVNSKADETGVSMIEESLKDPLDDLNSSQLARVQELQAALPGLPINRVKKVAKAFESTLSYPSLLTLVPILRETFPDRVTQGWLTRMNTRNAEFVLQRAREEGLIDVPMLNSMLQVKANAASLDEAARFHQEEFRRHNFKPTAYSDRLILQMFVDNNRIGRAFDFKRSIEAENRRLDLPSYGSLIEYCSKHQQLGSAMMLLHECFAQHGTHPSEKYLGKLRVLARQFHMDDELRLAEMIGQDPTEWLKYGERYLKREKSKKGRRDVQLAYNRALG